jgi:hypothetical protein
LAIVSKKRAKRACSALSAFGAIVGFELSPTGQLRDCRGRGRHLTAVGSLSPGTDRAAPLAQLRPLPLSVDENAALVESAIQEERRVSFNPPQMRDIHRTTRRGAQSDTQVAAGGEAIVAKRDQQVQIGVLILVTARQRAIEHSQPDSALIPKRPTKRREKRPMLMEIPALARGQVQAPRARASRAQSPFRGGATQGALLNR